MVGQTLIKVKYSAEEIAEAKTKAEAKVLAFTAAQAQDVKALKAAGYPAKADMAKFDKFTVL